MFGFFNWFMKFGIFLFFIGFIVISLYNFSVLQKWVSMKRTPLNI